MSEFQIPYPKNEIYESKLTPVTQVTQEAQDVFIIDHIDYPESGGIFVYLKGVLYPTKGFPTPESVGTNNWAKRVLITQLRFFVTNKFLLIGFTFAPFKTLSNWIKEYTEVAQMALSSFLMKDSYYSVPSKAIRTFIDTFLNELGISNPLFAKIFAHLIEFDTAYRYRIEDILSETCGQDMLNKPVREIMRLLKIFAIRENRPHLVRKFKWIGYGLAIALLIPRVKKAFRKAINSIEFKDLQFDEADYYHVLKLDGYEFLGRSIEDRIQEYITMHNGTPPETIRVQSK